MWYTLKYMAKDSKLKTIRHERWELKKAILEIIVMTVVSGGGSPLRPILPLAIKSIIRILKEDKKLATEEKKVKRVLDNLEKQELISVREKGDSVIVHTINENHPMIMRYSIKSLLDFKKKEKKWTGKWYAVFFDVPEIQRSKRDYLRRYLTKLGFYRYQKSVYILPYECEEEIALIKKIVEGAKYMKYGVIEKIEDEDRLKNFFSL